MTLDLNTRCVWRLQITVIGIKRLIEKPRTDEKKTRQQEVNSFVQTLFQRALLSWKVRKSEMPFGSTWPDNWLPSPFSIKPTKYTTTDVDKVSDKRVDNLLKIIGVWTLTEKDNAGIFWSHSVVSFTGFKRRVQRHRKFALRCESSIVFFPLLWKWRCFSSSCLFLPFNATFLHHKIPTQPRCTSSTRRHIFFSFN